MTPKQERFVQEYLIDLNATQAAIRSGYSERTAKAVGHENLTKPDVAAAIGARQAKRSEKTDITAERVLEELWAIATANPNDLIQFRRSACAYCWGDPLDSGESQEPQAHGGTLKRVRRVLANCDIGEEPNPDCPECAGEGSGRAFVADTRFLKGAASKLYAGVKVTKDGLEVKMHDKVAALVNVGRHLGMFKDHTEHSGPNGGPIPLGARIDLSGLNPEQLRALANVKLPADR